MVTPALCPWSDRGPSASLPFVMSLLAVLAGVACSGVGVSGDPFSSAGGGVGGSPGAAAGSDALGSVPASGGCSPDAPFGAPTRVPGLPDGAVRLRLSPDERVGYFARWSSTTNYDILVATRGSLGDAFGPAESLSFNGSAWDFSPTVTSDGSVLYFESSRSGLWKIYQSRWDPAAETFGPVELTPEASDPTGTHHDGGPYVIPSGDALYFHTTRLGDRSLIAEARLTGAASGGVRLTPPRVNYPQSFPVVSPDERVMYVAAFVGPDPDYAQTDIWVYTRASTSAAFGFFRMMDELNTPANEIPSFISEDGCRLYFDRNTGVPFGWGRPDDSVYIAERLPTQ